MNELQIFNNPDFGEVRTTTHNDEIAFVAKDVAERLGYVWKGMSGTMQHIPEEWRGVCSVQTPSGTQEMAVLTEQGLYFFLARSDKPRALPFQKWIAGEVIPSIRKHGAYITPAKMEAMMSDPDVWIELLKAIKAEKQKFAVVEAEKAKLEEKVEADAPKVAFADAVAASNLSIPAGEMPKIFRQRGVLLGRTRFYELLREGEYFEKIGAARNTPTQKSMELGLFEITVVKGKKGLRRTVQITPKGQLFLIRKFLGASEHSATRLMRLPGKQSKP